MNDNRSPLGDKKLTFIGILITVMIAVIFVLFNFNTKKYSDVEAAAMKSTEVTTEQQTTSTNPVEESTYVNNYIGEEKARIAHESYVYDKYYGIPDSVKNEIKRAKARDYKEEVDTLDPGVSDITTTPCATNGKIEQKLVDIKAKPLQQLITIEADVIAEEDTQEEEEDTSNDMTYYGCLELTAYTWTGNPCADGVYPSSGYTVACNNSDLWHKWIYIEGYGNYYVHDTGGMGYGVIDVYMDSYDACIQFGRRSANIYVLD